MLGWLDFLISKIDQKYFSEENKDIRTNLLDRCKEILDLIFGIISPDKFIELLRSDEREIVKNKYMMDRTMNHFRQQQIMTGNSALIILEDNMKIDALISVDLNCAMKTQFRNLNSESQNLMVFKWCQHSVPASQGLKEGHQIHCHICNKYDENSFMLNVIEKFELKKEIPLSDNYISTVVSYHL